MERVGAESSSAAEYDGVAGTPDAGQDKTEMSPSIVHQLGEEIGKRRTLLQREFDKQRMHRELMHIEIEKLHVARENQLVNRQFMAVLKERRELDRERREMITAAVEIWKTLSGDKKDFSGGKVHNMNEAILKSLHKSASTSMINEEEPRLLKRLRMCKTEAEVRSLQADLKKKQEVLFQLLFKSETMIATGMYYRDTKEHGNEDEETPVKSTESKSSKNAVKRPRTSDSVESNQLVGVPLPPPNQQSTNTSQPMNVFGGNAQLTIEERPDVQPVNDERTRSRNVLTWNLDVSGIRETAI